MLVDSRLQTSSLAGVTRHLLERHQIAFAHLSSDFRVVEHSGNFRNILIDPPEVIVGQAIDSLMWEFVGATEGLEEVLQQKTERFQIEYALRERLDGKVQYFNITVTSLLEEGSPIGLLLIIEDMTQQANLERELFQERNELLLVQNRLAGANAQLNKINRLKSLFLSMAAHDLRAPLTVILGYVELQKGLLKSGKLDQVEKFSDIMTDQIERMNRLIRDFLDLDQLEQGKFRLKVKNCDLIEILQTIISLMEHTAERNKIQLIGELPAKPVMVQVDPERMQQVAYNLISNAIKYTRSGGKVFVSVSETDNTVHFQIKDTGDGMTKEAMSQLFQIYYRTSEARESRTEGTGLGLYIVKTIVEAHHGQVKVTSQSGEGSTFTVSLPLHQITDEY